MPTSIGRALWNTALHKASLRKIESGFFRDNLIVVIGPGKSGTKSLCEAICALQDAHGLSAPSWKRPYRDGWTGGRYMIDNGDLQIEAVIDVIDGGVLHTHAAPNYRTFRVLEQLGSKHVFLARNPLHQLVSRYTHCLFEINNSAGKSVRQYFMDAVCPIPSKVFDGHKNTDDVIGYLIDGGYLEAQLVWIASWLEFRDPDRSIAIRFEDLISTPDAVYEKLSQFLFGWGFQPDIIQRCQDALNFQSDMRKEQSDNLHFLRGWTRSEEGIMAYVNDENLRSYKNVVSRFVDSHPHGKRLLEIFPDIAEI